MKATSKKTLKQCVDSVFAVEGEMIEKRGEDSLMYSLTEHCGIIGVFDGCGGLGSRKYPIYSNNSGAYIASRVAAQATMECFEQFLESGMPLNANAMQDICSNLKNNIVAKLSYYNKAVHVASIKGSLTKSFPTTASIVMFTNQNQKLYPYFIWAGDSRGYTLTPEGLTQITVDDIENEADALDNLSSDGKLSNVVSAEGDFQLHHTSGPASEKGVLITSTDGCFGYFATPMQFEYMLLDTLEKSSSFSEWKEKLEAYIKEYTGDDHTIGLVVYGFKSFKKLQQMYDDRYHYLWDHFCKPLQDADEELKTQLWNEYKDHYYGSVR